jgi:hypothetical protein
VSRFAAVCAHAALRVERGEITYAEALHALVWRERFQRDRIDAVDTRTPEQQIADDVFIQAHFLDEWCARADDARLRAKGRARAAIVPLLGVRAPSADLLDAARSAAGKAVLTDDEMVRLVETEVWWLLRRERRAQRSARASA